MQALRKLAKKSVAEEPAAEVHVEEDARVAIEVERNKFLREENLNDFNAQQRGEVYKRRELPAHLRDEAYDAQQEAELEAKQIAHEKAEIIRKADLGGDYVRRPFEEEEDDAPPPAPAPPPADMEANLAETLGALGYGQASELDHRASFFQSQTLNARAASSVNVSTPALKCGWAGIFDRPEGVKPPAYNPFVGPVIPPHQWVTLPTMQSTHANVLPEMGIPVHIQQRLYEGRGLATLARNNHEGGTQLRAQGKRSEALAAFQAADAGYEQALKLLMPVRKDLQEGPASSLPARNREGVQLQKLVGTLLDQWESIKPHLVPSVPGTATGGPGSNIGGGNGGGVQAGDSAQMGSFRERFGRMDIKDPSPPRDASQGASLYSINGELNLDAIPSVPTHDIEIAPTWEEPTTGGPKKCFICLNKSAEVVTPCNHYFCTTCADQMFGLFPNECPQCKMNCNRSQLKAIA